MLSSRREWKCMLLRNVWWSYSFHISYVLCISLSENKTRKNMNDRQNWHKLCEYNLNICSFTVSISPFIFDTSNNQLLYRICHSYFTDQIHTTHACMHVHLLCIQKKRKVKLKYLRRVKNLLIVEMRLQLPLVPTHLNYLHCLINLLCLNALAMY